MIRRAAVLNYIRDIEIQNRLIKRKNYPIIKIKRAADHTSSIQKNDIT